MESGHETFSTVVFLPSTESARAVVSFLPKNVLKYLLAAERTKPAQENFGLVN